MIKGHGNNLYHFGEREIEFDFSSNVAFNNHSQQICDYLSGVMNSIGDYPDPEARELTEALAKQLLVSEDELLVTNGSAEAFYLIAHFMQRQGRVRTAVVVPSFAEYEDSCRVYGHEMDFIGFDELRGGDLSAYGSVWFGLPNNPDGVRVDCAEVRRLAERYAECYFVVDRAYNELSREVERSWDLPKNIIIVDSFTKLYGVPGLRLGYLIGAADVVAELSNIRPPWSVNSLSQLAGLYILEHYDELQIDRVELIGEAKYLQREIAKIDGFRVVPSECNFFVVEIEREGVTSEDLQRYLIENHGILIRDCSNFRTLTPQYFRVAAQPRTACDRLISALKQWR